MNELILMQIGTSDPWGEGMKCSTLGSVGQRSRSHEAKDRFGGPDEGVILDPSSTLLGRVAIVLLYYINHLAADVAGNAGIVFVLVCSSVCCDVGFFVAILRFFYL